MELARKALAGLLWLYVAGVMLEFFLAGLGLPQLGDEGMGAHKGLGYTLELFAIVFLVLAAVGRLPRMTVIMIAVFAVAAILQPIWASEFKGEALAALHVLGAAVLLVMAHALARIVTRHINEAGEVAQ